jgi:uncharacterized protein
MDRGGWALIALPDVNLLMALTWSNHPHHERAHRWFAESAENGWATCLLTQTGFLRLSLNRQIVGVSIDSGTALALLTMLLSHPGHRYLETIPGLTAGPFVEIASQITGYRQVTDATLLHLARTHGTKLVTFDKPVAAICPWAENLEILAF